MTDSKELHSVVPAEQSEQRLSPLTFAEGSLFGDRFRIKRAIASGGMASVYEATDLVHGDVSVALKVIHDRLEGDEEASERFTREAHVLLQLRHPNVVAVHDFGRAPDGRAWLAMELLEGETLRDYIERQGSVSVEILVNFLIDAASGLEAAHVRGIVHRDLKPDNLFIVRDQSNNVKILDFGLSSLANSKQLTHPDAILGTPRYMAPEQLLAAHNSDARVDVYALGVIAYEALAGESPFVASDQRQLIGAILQGNHQPLVAHRPELHPALEQVLACAMAVDLEQRYVSPSAFAEAFEQAVQVMDTEWGPLESRATVLMEKAPDYEPPLPKQKAKATKKSTVIMCLLAGALGLALCAAGFFCILCVLQR